MLKLRHAVLAMVCVAAAALPGRLTAQQAETGPDTVVFTPERGAVTFTHGKHAKAAECVSCHHASKPEKPATKENEKCSACHSTPAVEPMKTTLRRAFHNSAEKTGVCFDCHNKEAAAGKTMPAKCDDCHKKEG
jgi:cytochrome c553